MLLSCHLLSFRKSTWDLRVIYAQIMRLSEVFKSFLIVRIFYRCVKVRPQCPRAPRRQTGRYLQTYFFYIYSWLLTN